MGIYGEKKLIEQFSVLIFWAHVLECTQYLLRKISIADLFCFLVTLRFLYSGFYGRKKLNT